MATAPTYSLTEEAEILRVKAFFDSIPDGSRLSVIMRGSRVHIERGITSARDPETALSPLIEYYREQVTAANIRANEEAERKIAAEKELRRIEEAYAKTDAENDRLREDCERSAREVARLTAQLRIIDLETEAARIADELTRARETLATAEA